MLGPQFEQLKMFMTGKELMNYVDDSYDRRDKEAGAVDSDGFFSSSEPYFDSVGNIVGGTKYGSDGNPIKESMSDMWGRKLRESKAGVRELTHGAGLYDSIKNQGMLPNSEAISILKDTAKGTVLGDGHHRTAVAADLEEQGGTERYLPVKYTAPTNDKVARLPTPARREDDLHLL